MTQRKLTRQLTLWEGPEPPPPPLTPATATASLTSPQSPLDATRSHSGSALFRRLKLNRSIQERRRSYHDGCSSYRFDTNSASRRSSSSLRHQATVAPSRSQSLPVAPSPPARFFQTLASPEPGDSALPLP